MLPIFRCSSKEHHVFFVFFWQRRCQKVTEVVVLKVVHMFILREYFWLSFFCSKSSEWTTTLIDTISIHNHGTPRCNDFHVNISLVGAKISFSRTSSLNFVRHFENSMRYHCFIPWWAPVSWDMTLMKPCVCVPRKLERSFLGWEDLQFGSLYFTTGPCWVFWVGDGEFSFCKWEWSTELSIPYFRERRGGSTCGSRDEWNVCVFFFSDLWFLRVWQHLETGLDTHKVTSNVRHIATCSSEGWDVSATSVQPTEAFRYLYL